MKTTNELLDDLMADHRNGLVSEAVYEILALVLRRVQQLEDERDRAVEYIQEQLYRGV